MTPNTIVPIPRWFMVVVALLLTGALHNPAFALDQNQTPTALNDLYRAQINAFYAINSFYNFSANQADQAQLELLNESVSNVDNNLRSLTDLFGENSTEGKLQKANEAWRQFRKVMDQNIKIVLKTGYTDLRLSGEMAVHNIETQSELSSLYKASAANAKIPEFEQLSRKASISMALMMTKYSARTTSTVSQAYSAGENELTIDVLAKELDETLRKMIILAATKEKAARPLDSAWSKWEFIRDSYINYNENRVNFVVNLYSRKIIDLLEEATSNI